MKMLLDVSDLEVINNLLKNISLIGKILLVGWGLIAFGLAMVKEK